MLVTIKLGAALAGFRPASERTNTFALDVPDSAVVTDLISSLGIPAEQPLMIIINDNLVLSEERDSRRLDADDKIAVMTPIHAG